MTELHLRVRPGVVQASLGRSGATVWQAEAPFETPADLADVIAQLAAVSPDPRCRRLAVTLEPPLVQQRRITDLPPVAPRALAALIAHQPGRFFRKNGTPLVTDAVWGRNGDARLARAAAADEALVEAIAAGARAAGLRLERVTPAGDDAALSLLPRSERTLRDRHNAWLVRRLVAVAALAWLLAAGVWATRVTVATRAAARALAAAEAPLAAMRAARLELRDAEAAVLAVRGAEAGRGAALALLAGLARVLPDSAVITSLTWERDGTGRVGVTARRPLEVIAALERSGVVERPRMEGPGAGGAFTVVFGIREPR